mmetsp:Transcript_51027/g.150419  ORF Transcript_51027/g.150419 Transcript_51027/m.150419 type:complete len:441 (+) Transcript_51027:113-1435(+)
MTDRELADAIQVIPDRLYWAALHCPPRNTNRTHYFSIDNDMMYEPFFADFGPLNLAMVYRYCKMLEAKLNDPSLADKRIVHYCAHEPKKRANAAALIGCYQVVVLHKPGDAAFDPFRGVYPPFLPFRDASCGVCNFHLTIEDCLIGLEKAIENRWFDYSRFDVESYEFFEKVENGDMNWIIPDKFLAFVGPSPTTTDADGFPAFTPEDYVPVFRDAGIGLIVRLNKKQYDRRRFIDHGIKHMDLYFLDGSCPPREIITNFLYATENEPTATAVHCKAGLGRTGTLIGLYAMKHYGFPARAWIGWNRICRPGSILGPQQQFLCDMQNDMFQAGAALRRPVAPPTPQADALTQQVREMSLRDRRDAETYEDVGQGERLYDARRRHPGSPAASPPALSALAPLSMSAPRPPGSLHGAPQAQQRAQPQERAVVGAIRSLRGVFS